MKIQYQRMVSRILLTVGLCAVMLSLSQAGEVYIAKVDGTINPSTADYIHTSIERAASGGAECLIIELNTPGGLLKSTRIIVTDILTSPIPVIVYVSPSGSQSASAGVFITLAAHVAVMAPGTNIGAAHPVMGGQPDSIMIEKATNDAAAFIRSISEERHRNVQWAEEAVRKSISITEKEALQLNVIDTIASSISELLILLDGKTLRTSRGEVTMHLSGIQVMQIEKSWQQEFLEVLTDPNIAYILMMLGMFGLLFELYNPGAILPGIVGFISLILGFYALHTLPINYAGLALIVFAIILFILEIKVISHGLLTIGGILALILGSIMLIQTDSLLEIAAISWEVILVVVLFTAIFFIFAIGMGIRAQRRKPTTGTQGLIGEHGEVMSEMKPDGQVRVHGEIWNAVSLDGTLIRGTGVIVEQIDNLTLKVRKQIQQ